MIEQLSTAPEQTAALARRFAAALPPPPLQVHLQGELGAGKTLWARALIIALGGAGAPSPSFALAFSYALPAMSVHHLDLFRLPQGALLPDELLELLQERALCLVEWPLRAVDLPPPDILLSLECCGDECRRLKFSAGSEQGAQCLHAFS